MSYAPDTLRRMTYTCFHALKTYLAAPSTFIPYPSTLPDVRTYHL